MSSQSVEIEIQSYRLQKRKDHIRAVIPILYFRIMNSFAILEDHNEVGAPPAPDAVGDYVGRVGDERDVVCVELARLVTGTVVVRVTDRRQRTVDHALQVTINLKGARHFVGHLVTAVIIPLPAYMHRRMRLSVIKVQLGNSTVFTARLHGSPCRPLY